MTPYVIAAFVVALVIGFGALLFALPVADAVAGQLDFGRSFLCVLAVLALIVAAVLVFKCFFDE